MKAKKTVSLDLIEFARGKKKQAAAAAMEQLIFKVKRSFLEMKEGGWEVAVALLTPSCPRFLWREIPLSKSICWETMRKRSWDCWKGNSIKEMK